MEIASKPGSTVPAEEGKSIGWHPKVEIDDQDVRLDL